jgi:hypothetical protein
MNTPLFIAYGVASVTVFVMAAIRLYNIRHHHDQNAARDRKHAEQAARRRARQLQVQV